MKQGKSYFTVILWILLAAIAAYFGYHVISSLYAPLMTATVTPYAVSYTHLTLPTIYSV